ncbi:MAG: hypothetical protein IJT52_07675 [Spirochaetales bacterium]|nr:hypothetical protein [Spirochaetales bacterium]
MAVKNINLVSDVLYSVIVASAFCALSIVLSTFYVARLFDGDEFLQIGAFLAEPLIVPSFAMGAVGTILYIAFILYLKGGKTYDSV